jgi:hypothetical protein
MHQKIELVGGLKPLKPTVLNPQQALALSNGTKSEYKDI